MTGRILHQLELFSADQQPEPSSSGSACEDMPPFVKHLVFSPSQSLIACTLNHLKLIFLIKVVEAETVELQLFDTIRLDSFASHIKFAPVSLLAATAVENMPLFVLTAQPQFLLFSIGSQLAQTKTLESEVITVPIFTFCYQSFHNVYHII
jgi:hypothetical protein